MEPRVIKPWIFRTLVVFTIGGSFPALAFMLGYVMQRGFDQPWLGLVLPLYFTYFVFGIVSALVLIEKEKLGIKLQTIFWAVQSMWFFSPIWSHKVFTGLDLQAGFINLRFFANFNFGFQVNFANQAPGSGFGFNLIALATMFYLALLWTDYRPQPPPRREVEPTPPQPRSVPREIDL